MHLVMSLKSSVDSQAQLFYDTGAGFTENDSQTLPVLAADSFSTLHFTLPPKTISHLRFDPLTRPGRVTLQNAVLLTAHDQVMDIFGRDDVLPLHQISSLTPDGPAVVVQTDPHGQDPMLILRLQTPVNPPTVSLGHIALVWLAWSVLTALVAGALLRLLESQRGVRAAIILEATFDSVTAYEQPSRAGITPDLRRNSLYLKGALLAILVILATTRALYLLTSPRFWAEEGTIFFQHATQHSLFSNIFFVFPESGYFILWTNLAAAGASITARFAGLQYAPAATTYAALIPPLAALAVILFGRSYLFRSWWRVIAACLIILVTPVAAGELWLNTINSPPYLGLLVLILLFEDTSGWSRFRRWIIRGVLALCGVSGLYGAILFPAYTLAYRVFRQREKLVQAGVLAICLITQAGVVTLVQKTAGLSRQRFRYVTLDSAIVNVFYHEVATPIAGQDIAMRGFEILGLKDALLAASSTPRHGRVTLAACFSLLLFFELFRALRGRTLLSTKVLLIAAFTIEASFVALGSLNGIPGPRYAFVAGTSLLFLVLDNIGAGKTYTSILCSVALIMSFGIGTLSYTKDLGFFRDTASPWRAEVARWRLDHNYELRVWPGWWPGRVHYEAP